MVSLDDSQILFLLQKFFQDIVSWNFDSEKVDQDEVFTIKIYYLSS
jgi:hypothetical protein